MNNIAATPWLRAGHIYCYVIACYADYVTPPQLSLFFTAAMTTPRHITPPDADILRYATLHMSYSHYISPPPP